MLPAFLQLVPQRHDTASSEALTKQRAGRGTLVVIFLGTDPWLENGFMSGSTTPPPIPTQCLSSLSLFLSWPSFLFFGPCLSPHCHCPAVGLWGMAGLRGQTDLPSIARLVASGCSCVPRGLEVERNWREVVRVQGHKGEGWFLSPPPLKPGLLSKWQQPGLLLLERSPSGTHPTWAASQHPHPSRATSLDRDGFWVLGPSAGQP